MFSPSALHALPKVELHLHLEGALRPSSVSELARQYEPDSPLAQPDWQATHWSFTDLTGFVAQLGQVLRTCLRRPEDYYRVARDCFEDLATQHVVYAEPSVSPRLPWHPHFVPIDELLAAVDQARREVEARTPLRIGLIVGLSRHFIGSDPERAAELATSLVEGALRARAAGASIVGIDLHGDEQAMPDVAPFAPAYRLAAAAGLGRRAHAGEATGPQSVRDALDRLEVTRIAHGVRAVEDPALVRRLAERHIALDLCPTSNVSTGAIPVLAAHPIRQFHEAGVPVTVNSDDPLVFSASITDELLLVHRQFGFTLAELGQLQVQAAAHSFLPPDRRAALAESVARAWQRASPGTSPRPSR